MGLSLAWFGPWAAVASEEFDDHPGHRVYVRFGIAPSGRLRVVELRIGAAEGVDAQVLRRVPLGRIEAMANSPGSADALRQLVEAASDEEILIGPLLGIDQDEVVEVGPVRRRSLRLTVPDGRRRPDEFYRAVAEAVATAATWSRRPAIEVAKANDVPTTTIHRWMKEARRRDVIAPSARHTRSKP